MEAGTTPSPSVASTAIPPPTVAPTVLLWNDPSDRNPPWACESVWLQLFPVLWPSEDPWLHPILKPMLLLCASVSDVDHDRDQEPPAEENDPWV